MSESSTTLMLGDCLERMKEIADGSVNMVLTDIPYGEVNKAALGTKGKAKGKGIRVLDKGLADVCDIDLDSLVAELSRVCTGSIYIFCGTEQVSQLRAGLVKQGFSTRLCIWEKTNPSPLHGQRMWLSSLESCVFARRAKSTFNEHCKSAVWRNPCGRSKQHPTEKPLALMKRLVLASSNAGDKILDCCMGSGTTGVAALELGRQFVGIEKSPEYFALAEERIAAAQLPAVQEAA